MAAVKEQEVKPQKDVANVPDVRQSIAEATRFYQKWEPRISKTLSEYQADVLALKNSIVQLLNAQESLERLNKEAEIKLAKSEREAQTRLQTVEMGHRALVDRLSKKEIEMSNKLADIEKRELAVAAERHRYELLKDEYERKLAGLARVEPAVSKK